MGNYTLFFLYKISNSINYALNFTYYVSLLSNVTCNSDFNFRNIQVLGKVDKFNGGASFRVRRL